MRDDVLGRLFAQAEGEGARVLTLVALVEEASEAAVERALGRLGLTDAKASADIAELRTLLAMWRDVRRSTSQALLLWAARGLLAALLCLFWVRGR